jgi:protein RecA
VIEVYGPESSGKTTLALHAIAEAQRAGGAAAFIDAEHALDVAYARAVGVETETLLISQPDTGEQALDITERLVRSETRRLTSHGARAVATARRYAGTRASTVPRMSPRHERRAALLEA